MRDEPESDPGDGDDYSDNGNPLENGPSVHGAIPVLKGTAIVLALASLVAYPLLSSIAIFWWMAVISLSLGLVVLTLDGWKLQPPSPCRDSKWELMLWGLAICAVAFNLLVHRPDTDDALYLNIAANAADAPDESLMAEDRMQGIEGLSFHSPVYLSNSIEPLWGVMSYLTGTRAQLWFHVAHAALGALFIVLAYAALFRMLVPDRWLLAVAVLLIILLGAGGTQNHWYGNLSFVRVWQGKCTFLHVFLPLTFVYSMRFAMQPSLYGWGLLAAAQIAAVGMSSSAIWVEPLAAGTGLLCGALGKGLKGWLRVLMGCIASSYVLGVGLILKGLLASRAAKILSENFRLRDYKSPTGFQEVLDTTGQALDWALKNVMGDGVLIYLCLGGMLICWAVCRSAMARRLAVLLPLLTLLFVMNPFAEKLIMANLTGPVFYRGTWLLPIPVFMTIAFLSALDIDPKRIPRKTLIAFMIVSLAGYVARVGDFNPYDRRNGIFYGRPGVKISPDILQVLRQAMNRLAPGAHVIAPSQFGPWFPTFQHPLYPVTVNTWYTLVRKHELTSEEVEWRIGLTDYISGAPGPEGFPEKLEEGLDYFGIQGVIVDDRSSSQEEIEAILQRNRFELMEVLEFRGEARYRLWVRPADDADIQNAPEWKVVELRS